MAACFIPAREHIPDVPVLEGCAASHRQLCLPSCRAQNTGCKHGEKSPQVCPHCPALLPHPITADGAARRHSSLRAGHGSDKIVLVGGCWQPCRQVRAERWMPTLVQWGTCTELMAAGLALLFTCRGSTAGALRASAFVPMLQGGRRVPVSGKGSWVRPVAQSSLPVGKAGREPWESTRRDGCHGSQCQ